MRTDLDHLPPQKQRELEHVMQLVFEEFDDAFALSKHEWKKAGRILKVILYGSYARGTWVDEPHTAKGYQSDYDLLIIVNDKRLTDSVKYWAKLDDRLMREYGVTETLKRSEEHTSELQSLMRISYAVFCLTIKKPHTRLYILFYSVH